MKLTKLEIDVNRVEQLAEATEFANINMCSALVVSPELVATANVYRSVKQAKHKVIAAIDWPKGEQRGQDKFRGTPIEALNADGFEILLSNPTNPKEIISEIKYLVTFVKGQFNPLFEVRFVLDVPSRSEQSLRTILETLKTTPMPTLVRTTHSMKSQNPKSIEQQIEAIQKLSVVPIKIGGSITANIYNNYYDNKRVAKMGTTFQQAQTIIKEMNKEATKAKVKAPAE